MGTAPGPALLVTVLSATILSTVISAASPPTFQVFPNTSICFGARAGPGDRRGESTATLKFLGKASTMDACSAAAAGWRNGTVPEQRCMSTCWWPRARNESEINQCYCRVSPVWMPLPSVEAESSVVEWPCSGPRDCSYNGVCGDGGKCACDPAWGGVRCGELQLLPVDRAAPGFREINRSLHTQSTRAVGVIHTNSSNTNHPNVSTWGAPVLWDEPSKQWHGWASEMTFGCGINAWETNSQIVHIVGNSPQGPFQRKEVFAPAFAHEPDVVRGPAGEWVMLYSGYNADTLEITGKGYNASSLAAAVCTNCSNGFTPPQGSPGCPFQRGTPAKLGHSFVQMMAIASSPGGPWNQSEIRPLTTGWDWNTALTINADNSAVGLIRGGMVWHANDYRDNTSWHPVGVPPGGGESPQWPVGVEDPYIWRDRNGVYHALAHCFTPFYGVHAYVHPEDVPSDFNDNVTAMNWTLGGSAYGNTVQFTDGTSFAFSRRERPHLVWKGGEEGTGSPIALTNGVEYGAAANTAYQDAIYTLSQPIAQQHTQKEKEKKNKKKKQHSTFIPTPVYGTKASVYLLPSGAPHGARAWVQSKGHPLFANDTLMAVWQRNHVADAAMLKRSLGDSENATVVIYFQAYLADTAVWGPAPLQRLKNAVAAYASQNIKSILFLGDPEFYGAGTWADTHDIVRNATARAYLLKCVETILAEPGLSAQLSFVSSYWLGASSRCTTCTEEQIGKLIGDIQRTANGANVTYLQHVDGPFWDAAGGEVNGYSAKSLAVAQGVMAESWCQGVLRNAVRALLAAGGASTSTLLMLNDVPNCDDASQPKRCSTGSLKGDTSAWFDDLDALGLGDTWGVWDLIDGGVGEENSYGDVQNDGTALTPKGALHRARGLSAPSSRP